MVATDHGERCPNCGAFCGVTYEWRGPSYSEIPACRACGLNFSFDAEPGGVRE